MESREWKIGNGECGMGNGEWEIEWEIENGKYNIFLH